jgi:hypothetical protein
MEPGTAVVLSLVSSVPSKLRLRRDPRVEEQNMRLYLSSSVNFSRVWVHSDAGALGTFGSAYFPAVFVGLELHSLSRCRFEPEVPARSVHGNSACTLKLKTPTINNVSHYRAGCPTYPATFP